jgi:nonribosomal peptide synthetase DhbF
LQPAGRSFQLFCIHPAGGTVFCYLNLVHELGPDHPVLGLQA